MAENSRRSRRHIRQRFDNAWERALLRGTVTALGFLIAGAVMIVLFGAVVLAITGISAHHHCGANCHTNK